MNYIHGPTVIGIVNETHTQGHNCAGAIAAAGNTKKAVHVATKGNCIIAGAINAI
jgi:hypothetical protein